MVAVTYGHDGACPCAIHVQSAAICGKDVLYAACTVGGAIASYRRYVAGAFHVEIHAYALMGNHVHLLVRTREANLGRLMQRVLSGYTQWFNAPRQEWLEMKETLSRWGDTVRERCGSGTTMREIGQAMGNVSRSAVSAVCSRIERQARRDKHLKRMLSRLS